MARPLRSYPTPLPLSLMAIGTFFSLKIADNGPWQLFSLHKKVLKKKKSQKITFSVVFPNLKKPPNGLAISGEEIFLRLPQGMQDSVEHHWGSWNCSRTDGPLGPPCDTDRERCTTGVYSSFYKGGGELMYVPVFHANFEVYPTESGLPYFSFLRREKKWVFIHSIEEI